MSRKRKADRAAYMRRYHKANRQKRTQQMRERRLRVQYGLTSLQYDQMAFEQDGKCAICGRQPPPKSELHVDHDHDTGAVRALLCVRCNVQLGVVEQFGARARAYLAHYGKPQNHSNGKRNAP